MKWLAEHVELFVLVVIIAIVGVITHLDEKRCAESCGSRGYTYRDGCGPNMCVCGAPADGGTR